MQEFSRCSSVNGDEASSSSPAHENSSQLISRMPPTPSSTHVISVGQLLESVFIMQLIKYFGINGMQPH